MPMHRRSATPPSPARQSRASRLRATTRGVPWAERRRSKGSGRPKLAELDLPEERVRDPGSRARRHGRAHRLRGDVLARSPTSLLRSHRGGACDVQDHADGRDRRGGGGHRIRHGRHAEADLRARDARALDDRVPADEEVSMGDAVSSRLRGAQGRRALGRRQHDVPLRRARRRDARVRRPTLH